MTSKGESIENSISTSKRCTWTESSKLLEEDNFLDNLDNDFEHPNKNGFCF